ncbi:MAG: hypothetical protein RL119_79 [Actinomycetota bacterium]
MVEPEVIRIELGLPAEPVLPRLLGEEGLRLEPHVEGEALGAGPHEHDVVGVLHHRLRHETRRRDVFQAPHRPGALGGPMHAARVELHHPVGVGEAAEPDGLVVGIELLDVDPGDDRVEGVGAADDLVVGDLHPADPVPGGDHHRAGGERPPIGDQRGRVRLRPWQGGGTDGERGCGSGRRGQEVAT